MKKVIMSVGFTVGLLAACGTLFAHHGRAAAFDEAHPLTLTGTTTKVDWINPHVFVYFDVKDDQGKVTNWGVEFTSPHGLIREGMSPDEFKPGTEVTMRFIPAKSGAPRGEIQRAWDSNKKIIYDGVEGYTGNIDSNFNGAEKPGYSEPVTSEPPK